MEISYKTLNRLFSRDELDYLINTLIDEQLESVMIDHDYCLFLQRLYDYIAGNIYAL